MTVGIPKETKVHEYRVGATPNNVAAYVSKGHRVLVQKGAGDGSGFSDDAYREAGAELLADVAAVWNQSGMIIKIKEPQAQEFGYFREGLVLYAYLHLASGRELTQQLLKKKVNAVAYDTITDPYGDLPFQRPMSAIAGRMAVMEGSSCMLRHHGGRGVMLGGVSSVERAHVVILGAGNVGRNALQMAVGLGARVSILDINLKTLADLDEIYGNRITTLYASEQHIENALISADLVIGAVLIPGRSTPKLIKKAHLAKMKNKTVFVDVAVDQGGCAETSRPATHEEPTYVVDGVIHYCVPNMPGVAAYTSTLALTAATLHYGLALAQDPEKAFQDPHIQAGLSTYRGKLCNQAVAESLEMEYTPYQTISRS